MGISKSKKSEAKLDLGHAIPGPFATTLAEGGPSIAAVTTASPALPDAKKIAFAS